MKSILFSTDATTRQIDAVRRALTNAGAASVVRLQGERVLLIVRDPAAEIPLDRYRSMPGVDDVMEQEEKNLHVSSARPQLDLTSGIEGLTVIAGPCGIESEEQVAL